MPLPLNTTTPKQEHLANLIKQETAKLDLVYQSKHALELQILQYDNVIRTLYTELLRAILKGE